MYPYTSLRFLLALLCVASSVLATPLRTAHAATFPPPYQVKDINSGPDTTTELKMSFTRMAALGTTVFFSACPEQLCGLWKVDASSTTAVQVASLDAENKTPPGNLMTVGGKVFFTAFGGSGLWSTDGTTKGTLKLADITLPSRLFQSSLPLMADLNGTLFFLTSTNELWKSDGTAAGTLRVKALPNEANTSLNTITVAGGKLFITEAVNTVSVLWKSDGTPAGTTQLQTLSGSPSDVVSLGSMIFLSVYNQNTSTNELWKSDGTPAGTLHTLDDFELAPYSYGETNKLGSIGSTLLFLATHDGQRGLWQSDGTISGTKLIYNTESIRSFDTTVVNGIPLFCTDINTFDNGSCSGLWHIDQPDNYFNQFVNLQIGTPRSSASQASDASPTFVPLKNNVFFASRKESNSYDLWKSDGTEKGTVRVKHPVPQTPYPIDEANNGLLSFITNAGGTLFFEFDQEVNSENYHSTLWKSDGTEAGTQQIKVALPKPGKSRPAGMTSIGNTVFFSADDGVSGRELWKSDGTTAGTTRVKDIRTGDDSAMTEYTALAAMQNTVYFAATDGTSGYELWKSDGTEQGTMRVKDINPGAGDAFEFGFSLFTVWNGALYFAANDGTSGYELWKSDGTAAGTVRVKDMNAGIKDSSPYNLTAVGSTLFFSANDGTSGYELWKSDGTAAGTVRVKDMNAGTRNSSPYDLTAVGNTLFFSADDGVSGRELWKSDGTAAGTLLVKDITTGTCNVNQQSTPCDSNLSDMVVALNGTLFFVAQASLSTNTTPPELWRSDGTAVGTIRVKQAPQKSGIDYLTRVGSSLFFSISNETTSELWRSDGTSKGTSIINKVTSGYVANVIPADDALCLLITSSTPTRELWCGDGTSAGTTKLQTFTTTLSIDENLLDYFLLAKGHLFFTEDDGHGLELWALALNGTTVQPRVFVPLAVR